MQKAMEAVQADLSAKEIEVSSGGGAVKVVVDGHGAVKSLKLDGEFLKEGAEVVESAILEAINEACAKAKSESEAEMSKITGGFSMPGLF
ncbi:YbaB/EbfC family nucleoid-associated protein [Opitutales bacterium CLA-KB-P66]|uniref:Nucleoid-associated protein MOX91_07595 n=2 Tax=Intestinicryptomonas porci TaxID=2926320 RepID=A0ABU4WKE5_9BACT|nr:YbaB/EbfC family nucleoid-associated protein [Opitutales bacterium CLA-KB-P66]